MAIPCNVIDDDDEFDWEAAVREIDVACETSVPSSSTCLLDSSLSIPYNKFKPGASRQTTLDQFVAKKTKGITFEKGSPTKSNYNYSNEYGEVCSMNIDVESAQTWIYPVNGKVPHRDYQFSISQTALFSNTLVALPTGLGKTFIAAVVMYNYFRWFPEGKIVFAAPSRPLVMQQIEACHNIVGIPQDMTIDLTGEICGGKRSFFWKTKRVFFVTPQVLENDIQSGICLVKYLVCLVIDEAHRALGNQSCSVAVRELMAARVNLRLLALTATPGSNHETIQKIIDNLHISTLEYRAESDHDVSQFVHNKEIELLKVSMGQNVVEVNDLLLEMIRPFATKLFALGVLLNQDPQPLTNAYILLKLRDKFRQAPPHELPPLKHREVEAYFGILLSLSHIYKLLSGHGIRSAYEMLEERMQDGFFANFMNKNEALWKAKLLMERSLSHEAPYPKLIKLLEVLTNHFQFHGPKESRTIIFSNFRRSVRDIMDALAKIGEPIKAAQFIGQTSAKSSKGQSRKDQQAVLEKFRAGVYNVLVATSIAEEGLDIVEVDLVVCFDANISSLRMIQRMGRTGRKHDGRVVVLACEGTELKGYMSKQALGKNIVKHMHNGGMNSFNFHPSPRMIPHVFKPEAQFVEMSIQPYIPRGKIIIKDDDEPIQNSRFKVKPSPDEKELLAKIFNSSQENTRKTSLIAFPHFQAFPSGIHIVNHSFKTGMLIDAMQHLDGLSFGRFTESFPFQNETSSSNCLGPEVVDKHDNEKEHSTVINISKDQSVRDLNCEVSTPNSFSVKENFTNIGHDAPTHSNLFSSGFVLVTAVGEVVIPSVPQLPLKEDQYGPKSLKDPCTNDSTFEISRSFNSGTQQVKVFDASEHLFHSPILNKNPSNEEHNTYVKVDSGSMAPILLDDECDNEYIDPGEFINTGTQQVKVFDDSQQHFHSPILNKNPTNQELNTSVMDDSGSIEPISLDDECGNELIDQVLSPRLTSLIKSGVVPESPINDAGHGRKEVISSPLKYTELEMKTPINDAGQNRKEFSISPELVMKAPINDASESRKEVVNSPPNQTEFIMETPITEKTGGVSAGSEIHIFLANSSKSSCSKDWQLGCGEKSERVHNFKRLRKYGGSCKRNLLESLDKFMVEQSSDQFNPRQKKHIIDKKRPAYDVRAFIEEEAEVSCAVEVSSDEEVTPEHKSSSINSFLDDTSNATPSTAAQAVTSTFDMLAVYRRSLLSQSPIGWNSKQISDRTPESMASSMGGSSKSISDCSPNSMFPTIMHPERGFLGSVSKEDKIRVEGGKRKLNIQEHQSIPSLKSFEQEPSPTYKESPLQNKASNGDAFTNDDDMFYESIDLDEVEKQATLILRSKTGFLGKENLIPEPSAPSFNLGI